MEQVVDVDQLIDALIEREGRLTATEQAIQLDEQIKWVKVQAEVPTTDPATQSK